MKTTLSGQILIMTAIFTIFSLIGVIVAIISEQ